VQFECCAAGLQCLGVACKDSPTTEMGSFRRPPAGLMTPTARQSAVGFILSHDDDPSQANRSRVSVQARSVIRCRAIAVWRSFKRTPTNLLPILLLGVLAAAFFFAFVLNAPTNVVLGILFVGFLTAVIETIGRNDLDRQ
jgi:hypothetical protein